jgi:replicative DNA helicase
MAERVLPHNLEAERAVLGALLVEERARHVAFGVLQPPDFYREAHGKIFIGMIALAHDASAIDLVTLREKLTQLGTLDDVGGPAYVASLTDGVPRSVNVEHYASIVKEHARRRTAIALGNDLLTGAYAAKEKASSVIDGVVTKLIQEIGSDARRPIDIYSASVEYTGGLDAGTMMLPTGYADLDDLLGGLPIGNLTVVAARPSVGKTTMALGVAQNIAEAGRVVAMFSLEMRRAELGARVSSWRSRVQTTTLERGTATETDYARFAEGQTGLVGLPLFIDDTSTTLVEIDAWCRRLKEEHGDLACVVIDYLQLLLPAAGRKQASRQEEVAGISRGLKRLAKDLRVSVVALSQLSRAPEARSDKRPHLSDLRESGALEQDADLAILLFRPEMHKRTEENHGLAEFIVAKNRTGPVGVVHACFLEEFAKFENLAKQQWQQQ